MSEPRKLAPRTPSKEMHRLALYLARYMESHPDDRFTLRSLHELLQGNTKYDLQESTTRKIAGIAGVSLRREYRRSVPQKNQYRMAREQDALLAQVLLEILNAIGYKVSSPIVMAKLHHIADYCEFLSQQPDTATDETLKPWVAPPATKNVG